MNSPVIILQNYLPQVLIDHIQQYLPPNKIVYEAIQKYFRHLRKRQELYNYFAYKQYVIDPCRGHKRYKPCLKRNENNICNHCQFMSEKWKDRTYWITSFTEIIYESSQYKKIVWYGTPSHLVPLHMRISKD